MFEGLLKPKTLIVIVVTLLAYGCPIQAIVQAFGLDERTVASWRDRAGTHCQEVHQAVVQQWHLDLVHVQADEIVREVREEDADVRVLQHVAETGHHAVPPVIGIGDSLVVQDPDEASRTSAEDAVALS